MNGVDTAEALQRITEQRDALLRLIRLIQAAAGIDNSADPIGDLETLRERADDAN